MRSPHIKAVKSCATISLTEPPQSLSGTPGISMLPLLPPEGGSAVKLEARNYHHASPRALLLEKPLRYAIKQKSAQYSQMASRAPQSQ